ncbi:flagellar hook-associated protein 2 [Oceanobacillus halotolerans]|uniref:flagellar hook-associated protein 2 n=1 Tax=Oceanobacillus halotolerans TaxID=2663380 RepID=UPI0013DB7947|nr:flagellar hook-associated protein 2 [Oceanobacillus halotolerans]
MRIGGLASGMDIDQLVNKLMEAERMPLQKMQQDQTKLEWQRDAFRDVNKELASLDDMMLNMKMSSTYNSKTVNSSNESAISATAGSSTPEGFYQIEVESLATSAINISAEELDLDVTESLDDHTGIYEFKTYDKNGEEREHKVEINEGDTINDVLKRISDDDNDVRAFYDAQSNKVIMEATRTGDYNEDGNEIEFDGNTFFTDVLKLSSGIDENGDPITDENGDLIGERGGENATFYYNGVEMTSKNNSYELNGVNFQFNDTGSANLTVSNDVDAAFDSIMEFVDKYNEVVDTLNGTQQEERFRDYPPLTDEQKEEMSEKEIELWEEKAQSGILRGESAISNGLLSLRQSWYETVDTGGEYQSLTQIGISTTSDYLDGGKLEVDEDTLKDALRNNPDDVHRLFSNSDDGESRGLVNRLEDAVGSTISQIENRAGKGTDTLEGYTLGKRLKDINDRIAAFEDRLVQKENRYWNQFTEMETAIQRMNTQSQQLMSQFGGGMM